MPPVLPGKVERGAGLPDLRLCGGSRPRRSGPARLAFVTPDGLLRHRQQRAGMRRHPAAKSPRRRRTGPPRAAPPRRWRRARRSDPGRYRRARTARLADRIAVRAATTCAADSRCSAARLTSAARADATPRIGIRQHRLRRRDAGVEFLRHRSAPAAGRRAPTWLSPTATSATSPRDLGRDRGRIRGDIGVVGALRRRRRPDPQRRPRSPPADGDRHRRSPSDATAGSRHRRRTAPSAIAVSLVIASIATVPFRPTRLHRSYDRL